MERLTSKIQYSNFELGEFIETKKRTYNEMIELIEKFPWNNQREKLVIDLTNPSITMERESGDYLKLAIYFNNKFVLYYLNSDEVLYNKSFNNIKDAYVFIKRYFNETLDSDDFKKQPTWFRNNLKHFVSQAFVYTVNFNSIKKFWWSTSAISFTFSFIMIFILLFSGMPTRISEILLILFLLFLVGGGLNLILFFNYYLHSRNKVLIMSKGNDIFYYGDINSPIKYHKNEINLVTIIRTKNFRILEDFSITKIDLKDSTQIIIPGLFLDGISLEQKLWDYPKVVKEGLAFIR